MQLRFRREGLIVCLVDRGGLSVGGGLFAWSTGVACLLSQTVLDEQYFRVIVSLIVLIVLLIVLIVLVIVLGIVGIVDFDT